MCASTRTSGTSISSLSARAPGGRAPASAARSGGRLRARSAGALGRRHCRAFEVELALGRGAVRRQLGRGVAAAPRRGGSATRRDRAGTRRWPCRSRGSARRRRRRAGPHDRLRLVGGHRPPTLTGLRHEPGELDGRRRRREVRRDPGDCAAGSVTIARPSSGVRLLAAPRPRRRPGGARRTRRSRTSSGGVPRDAMLVTSASSTSAGVGPRRGPRPALGQALTEAVELEEVEQVPHLVDVRGWRSSSSTVTPTGAPQISFMISAFWRTLILVLAQAGPQLGVLVEVLEDAVDAQVVTSLAAVSPTPALRGGCRTCRRQRRVSQVHRRRHTRPLLDAGLVVEDGSDTSSVVEHLDVRVLDELVDVPVAGHDDDVEPGVAALVASVAMMSSAS